MNLSGLSEVQERRRIAASILQKKYSNSHSTPPYRYSAKGGISDAESYDKAREGDDEFIDSIVTNPRQVMAAPSNRLVRGEWYFPPSPSFSQRRTMQKLASKSSANQSEHQYLLGPNKQQKYYNRINNNYRKQSLNPVNESESVKFSGRCRRLDLKQQHEVEKNLRSLYITSKSGESSIPVVNKCVEKQESLRGLASEVKKRLSLPIETSIPERFLMNLKNRLDEIRQPFEISLSRVDRRQSLADIGFGKSDTYNKLHVLGAGTYSIVYKGVSCLTDKLIALKEIHLERDEGVPFTAIREVSLLKQLKHFNIITLHDIIYTSRTLTLVFEYVDRDLSRYLDECDHNIHLDNVRMYLFQLLRALKYCHERKILHRDIKPQNILISNIGELKLADFGLARAKSFPTKTYTDEVVTLWYRPPDVLLGNVNYGTCIDMWGVGCIFFEMIAGYALFLGTDPKKQISCIFEITGTPDELDWPNINSDLKFNEINIPHYIGKSLTSMAPRLDKTSADLLSSLLRCNPKKRISSSEAICHQYFSSFPQEIYDIDDSVSIFSVTSVKLSEEQTRNKTAASYNINV